jgi:hypothetical protein
MLAVNSKPQVKDIHTPSEICEIGAPGTVEKVAAGAEVVAGAWG